MTENANPKPFNISRLKCRRRISLREQLSWVYQSINQSIKRCVYGQTGWTEFKSKTI